MLLDKFYTPPGISDVVVEQVGNLDPLSCGDLSCGSGSLLRAARKRFSDSLLLGADLDRCAIRRLQKEFPDWQLSVADVLNPNSICRTGVYAQKSKIDLILMNPPFSHGNKKYVRQKFREKTYQVSVSMAHILGSLDLFEPRLGAVAIVPESLVYSQTDAEAREALGDVYDVEKVYELSRATFSGAYARSCILRIGPRGNCVELKPRNKRRVLKITMIRGGLPVHLNGPSPAGIPYIHSTDLERIAKGKAKAISSFTSTTRKGICRGWMVLITRVGVPKKENVVPLFLQRKAQLSDCVISLSVESRGDAKLLQRLLLDNWASLIDQYRGTGARYVTIERLVTWFSRIGIEAETA